MPQTSHYAFYSGLRKIKLSQAGTPQWLWLYSGFHPVQLQADGALWRGVVRTHYNNKGSQEGTAATRPQQRAGQAETNISVLLFDGKTETDLIGLLWADQLSGRAAAGGRTTSTEFSIHIF